MQAMGISVPKMSAVVNRTTHDLNGTFNGQPLVIPAGYKPIEVPKMRLVKGKDGAPDTEEPVLKDGNPVMQRRIIGAGPGGIALAVMLPDYAAEMVKRQNVVMGTEDPDNPRDVQYLIGSEAWGDDISHLEQSDAIERLDRSLMGDDAQGAVVRGAKRKRSRGFTDDRLYNPGGIRGDVGPAAR